MRVPVVCAIYQCAWCGMSFVSVKDMRYFCTLAGIPGCSKAVKADVEDLVDEHLRGHKYPQRYLKGLSEDEAWRKKFEMRLHELEEREGGAASYERLESDAHAPHKQSTYTKRWLSKHPDATNIPAASKVSGVPEDVLHRVYSKGLAAWRGGHHRPGASQHAWAMARVYSFLTKGKTFHTADRILAEEAIDRSAKTRRFWNV